MLDGNSTRDTLPEAPNSVDSSLDFLKQLNISAIHLGLERIKTVLPLLGNPQNQRPCIHVAGTNGKGSTCAMLESIYRHNGYRTGLTVSPHLMSPLERIQVNRQPLSDDAWMDSFMRVYHAVNSLPKGYLSYFEWVMLMAFDAFNRAEVDIAIIETGLGGRLDATNVIDHPVATILTSISLDHQERLGSTLTAIATEKADIIRPNTPVISSLQHPDVDHVINDVVKKRHTNRIQATPVWIPKHTQLLPHDDHTTMTRQYTYAGPHESSTQHDIQLSLLGHYQESNLAVALRTVETLEAQFPTKWPQTQYALAHTHWPGRYQWVKNPYGGWLIVDGSHNEDGLAKLAHSINHDCPDLLGADMAANSPLTIGVSLMQHRNPEHLVSFVKGLSVPVQVYCLELDFTHMPAMYSPSDLATYMTQALSTSISTRSLPAFLQETPGHSLITGSLYSAGHALSQLSQIGVHHPLAGLAPSS